MSIRVMTWVWEQSRSAGADRLVLLAIADSANDAGRDAYPSLTTIAKKANLDKRTAQRSIRNLEALGELAIEPGAGMRGTNRYRVLIHRGWRPTTPPGITPPGDTPPPTANGHRSDATPNGNTPPGTATRHGGGGDTPGGGRRDATRTVLEPSLVVTSRGEDPEPSEPGSEHGPPNDEDDQDPEPVCPRHRRGNPDDQPCNGCAETRRLRAGWERRQRAHATNRRRNCPDCHGTGWTEHDDGTPAGHCTHHRSTA